MRLFKKLLIFSFLIIICVIWIYQVYDINKAYPSPIEIIHRQNDTFEYYDMQVTGQSIEIYNYEEICEKYNGYEEFAKDDDIAVNSYYILCNFYVQNNHDYDISLKDIGFTSWMIEYGLGSDGVDMNLAYVVNYSSDVYKSHSSMSIQIPFRIYQELTTATSKEELLKQGIKIVTNYYPEKEYIVYCSDEET